MMLLGYQITERIHESPKSLIYRGRRQADQQPVVVKLLNETYPSPERVAWFKREYEVTRSLNMAGVINAYSLEHDQQHWLMSLEDFGGDSLTRLSLAGKLDVAAFLRLALEITTIVGHLHQRQIIHKDINPSNILLNAATLEVKIIDFGISTVLSQESSSFRNPNMVEGTLNYISPEQTGRMNRAVDYRTDFYSLGVTFYELLTGQLPFQSNDPLELVHNHIAKQAVPPHEVKPGLPLPLSHIIMKLMAKNAEDRYQSVHGLQADLAECLRQWQTGGRIEPFSLGRSDVSDRFQIPQKLYGREQEIETLLTAFGRVNSPALATRGLKGGVELMLVSGYSGIGKSALVQEIYKPITQQRGYFISGKFDQFQREIPYASLIQAFQSLMRQLLTESEIEIATWREKLLAALGPNGQVIIEVIPEVELIIGPQPELPQLEPAQSLNRFNLVLQNFIRVFTQPEHPLVIFLDDLQWADGASLKLIKLLITDPDSHYLFLIGAYRDNEVSESHPLMLTLADIKEAGAIVNQITLSPLNAVHVDQLVGDTLKTTPAQVRPLSELVRTKTGGNPFFINEFLKSLHAEGLITFNYDQAAWRWDLARIQAQNITDNVVELMANKIKRLPAETQTILQLAACIGNQFDLETLAVVSEKSLVQAARSLWAGVVEGLVLPLNETYKLAEVGAELAELEQLGELVTYKFAHDRVQQAVYSLIPETDRQTVHLRIGQLLLRNISLEERRERIFDIVNQLNQGQALITGWDERRELAALNLTAGQKAKTATAYQPAVSYLHTGLSLLAGSPPTPAGMDEVWQSDYELALNLHVEATEAAYLSGDFEQAAHLSEVVLQQGRDILDQIRVYDVRIQTHIARSQMKEALELGVQVLEKLGVPLATEPPPLTLTVEELYELPEMTGPHKLAAMQLAMNLFPSFYIANPVLLPRLAFTMVKLCLEYGNPAAASFAYVFYGLLLCGRMGQIELGYQFGQLGLRILEKFQARELECKVFYMFNVTIRHWKEAAATTIEPLRQAIQAGLESGDIAWVGYATYFYCANLPLVGAPLEAVSEKQLPHVELMGKIKQQTALYSTQIWSQFVLNLRGQAPDKHRLVGQLFDEDKMLPVLRQTNNLATLFRAYLVKTMLSYLFRDYQAALANATLTAQYEHAASGLFIVTQHPFYHSLTLLAVYPEAGPETQPEYLKIIEGHQQKMAMWAAHAPMNFQHKYDLVEAEKARVLGQPWRAVELYEQAIRGATDNDYLHEEALACELAGEFYLARGLEEVAQLYLNKAYHGYSLWQATAKVEDLQNRYPHWLAQPERVEPDLKTTASLSGTATGTRAASLFDLTSVLKASQAISGEIVLSNLLTNLMEIVIENAGAERGFLLLNADGQSQPQTGLNLGREAAARWVIEAEGAIDKDEVTVLHSIPVVPVQSSQKEGGEGGLPISIINYVTRTRRSVVLDDAARPGPFSQDPYIRARQPKSVLCAPLLNQGRLTGILYLENNLTTAAFTPARLEVLNLLSSQAAISIENAALYNTLERNEKKYRTLFEDSKDAIFITTPDGQILDMNPAGLELFGYTREEINRVSMRDIYATPADRRRFREAIETQGAVRDFEVKYRKKDGTELDCLETASVRRAEDGTILTYEGIIRDITAQKRAEQERLQLTAIQRELSIAHEMQQSLLPPPKPDWPDLDVICYSMPAREVGGDFYSYYAFPSTSKSEGDPLSPLIDYRYALTIGDISGKGVSAALLMSTSLSQFDAALALEFTPAERMLYLDKAMSFYTGRRQQNCAMCYAEIISFSPSSTADKSEIILRVANAGCIPPYIKRINGEVEEIDIGGFALGQGFGTEFGYEEISRNLAKGDLVILTSDGIVEAQNAQEELFGFDRLLQALARGPVTSAQAMLEHLKAEVAAFAAGTEPHDDMTIVIVQV